MKKKLLLKKSLLLILYTLVQLYLMVFNWKLFTLKQSINLGFVTVSLPPFVVISLVGFIIIVALTWVNYILSLKKIIYELESGLEHSRMQDKQVMKKVRELVTKEENVDLLKDKLGIAEIRTKQEELMQMMTDLKKHLENRDQRSLS